MSVIGVDKYILDQSINQSINNLFAK